MPQLSSPRLMEAETSSRLMMAPAAENSIAAQRASHHTKPGGAAPSGLVEPSLRDELANLDPEEDMMPVDAARMAAKISVAPMMDWAEYHFISMIYISSCAVWAQ
jgi:hypothetical protein